MQKMQTSGTEKRDQVVKAMYLLNKKCRSYCVVLDTMWKSVTELPSPRRLLFFWVFLNWQGCFLKKISCCLAPLILIYHQDTKQKQN